MELNIKDFTYNLPEERIAFYPLDKRDQSKLLFYNKGSIGHHQFTDLPALLPPDTLLFFNDTKVIPARLLFHKATGARIEIFLLDPIAPSTLVADAMQTQSTCTWRCTVGNLKKWSPSSFLEKSIGPCRLKAELLDREKGIVRFTWTPEQSFAELISQLGATPLPPYIHRQADDQDKERYQTVYSHYEGAVAAPTAGLHFTDTLLNSILAQGVATDYLTLHVSAGTFQPVKTEQAADHIMHEEQVVITRQNLENLLSKKKFVIAVGTTSMRTLESLYWYGVKLLQDRESAFIINQDEPYQYGKDAPPMETAIQAVLDYMITQQIQTLHGRTSIYILPGYTFRVCKGLITNFHQPQSTLILLVAAFIGNDWRAVYQAALQHHYRFLSYGDSSLLIP